MLYFQLSEIEVVMESKKWCSQYFLNDFGDGKQKERISEHI